MTSNKLDGWKSIAVEVSRHFEKRQPQLVDQILLEVGNEASNYKSIDSNSLVGIGSLIISVAQLVYMIKEGKTGRDLNGKKEISSWVKMRFNSKFGVSSETVDEVVEKSVEIVFEQRNGIE